MFHVSIYDAIIAIENISRGPCVRVHMERDSADDHSEIHLSAY